MVAHEDDLSFNHKFADHLSFPEEKEIWLETWIICSSNSKRTWRFRFKSSSTWSNL